MITNTGNVALSPFRVNALITAMNQVLNSSAIVALRGVHVHYIKPKDGEEISSEQLEKIFDVLDYDRKCPENDELYAELKTAIEQASSVPGEGETNFVLQVVPLSGNISPWSSKATNILQNCGFNSLERIERGTALLITVRKGFPLTEHIQSPGFLNVLHDRMTQQVIEGTSVPAEKLFVSSEPRKLQLMPRKSIAGANKAMGLAMDQAEIDYLNSAFPHRDPTDAELFMFAQVNSEHCRHKIFNAQWKFNGERDYRSKSLFKMIKTTHENNAHQNHTISAYSDNAAVMEGSNGYYYAPSAKDDYVYQLKREEVPYLAKVETHNHPTAVSPFPGAATGSGGEIRDEGAVGQGSKSKAGLAGFTVSDLLIPTLPQPWELQVGKPEHIASSLDIMLEAPLGSASFNNEFGRPALGGYFRTLTIDVAAPTSNTSTSSAGVNSSVLSTSTPAAAASSASIASTGASGSAGNSGSNSNGSHAADADIRGFHKPIMLAGGIGTVRPRFALKDRVVPPGSALIVLGGPAMLIGLGGGAASSVAAGGDAAKASLDFASVQRGNPEMQRRAQMVIDSCVALGEKSPILSIHDVGAGGLSNAFTELVHDNGLGAEFEIRNVPCDDPSMSSMEIWCCEAQERYVLAVSPENLSMFESICQRERAVYGVVGYAKAEPHLTVTDSKFPDSPKPVDLDMSVLFGNAPRMHLSDNTKNVNLPAFKLESAEFSEALRRVLQIPSVGSKSFLVTIGDRSITGLVAREQMVGPWQVPVADVAVTISSYGDDIYTGEAFSSGERPAVAIVNAGAASRVALAESLLNLYAADVRQLEEVRLSANWMAAPANPGDGYALYEAVQALSDACLPLGVSIPVGKDSMSMKMQWGDRKVTSPVTVVISAFSAVSDIRKTWTPQLQRTSGTKLVYISAGSATHAANGGALGATAVSQAFGKLGGNIPDVDIQVLRSLLLAMEALHRTDIVKAYHDISDGGVVAAILEMAFAGRTGVEFSENDVNVLFDETPGAVFQVSDADMSTFMETLTSNGIPSGNISIVGKPDLGKEQPIFWKGLKYESTRAELQKLWSLTSHHMQRLRDNPKCADQELSNISDNNDPGLSYHFQFKPCPSPQLALEHLDHTHRPKVAVLREQGINGYMEMAYSMQVAGFEPVDVHMTDLIGGKVSLETFTGLAAPGGFSYGDVLGAGNGWASSILYNSKVRQMFVDFFARPDTFTLGVCNGCQFLSHIKSLIPGCESWPSFERNISEQFEGRTSMLEVYDDDEQQARSVFVGPMKGSRFPIAIAHGEGRAHFDSPEQAKEFYSKHLGVLRYVDNYGKSTERYPYNPNGSPQGLAGVRSPDGRVLAMMPHPERNTVLDAQSWKADDLKVAPWLELFLNARLWVESHKSNSEAN